MNTQRTVAIALGLFVCLALLAPAPAVAQSYTTCTVTTDADSGPGSLRSMLEDSDTICYRIVFDKDYTIRLKSTLELTKYGNNPAVGRWIDGEDHRIEISGEDKVRVFLVYNHSLLHNLIITNGHCGADCPPPDYDKSNPNGEPGDGLGDGGAIYVRSDLDLYRCTFSGNSATTDGGAIYIRADLWGGGRVRVSSSVFINNSAGRFGGAISGGGTRPVQRIAPLSVYSSRFTGNQADDSGGAIRGLGDLDSSLNSFSNNNAGHDGGAIDIRASRTQIHSSTFSGNTASAGSGGGVHSFGQYFSVTNSTFQGNRAPAGSGGGISCSESVYCYLTNSTLAGNGAVSGGGISAGSEPERYRVLRNSIIAGSSSGSNCDSNSASGVGSTSNQADDSTCGSSFETSSSILLGPLGDYGGSNETMPLLPGSSAIGKGDAGVCAELYYSGSPFAFRSVHSIDQRGVTRPQGTACDIGAYEAGYLPLVQQPINADGSSVFDASRRVVPIKFILTYAGQPTCSLPGATISVQRLASDGSATPVNQMDYIQAADTGSMFRIDQSNCQYVYNLGSRSLGAGTYVVKISVNGGKEAGTASFVLK